MKTLIIGRPQAGEKNDITVLAEQLVAQSGMTVEHAFYEDVVCRIGAAETTSVLVRVADETVPLESYGLVILLQWTASRALGDIAHAVAMYAESKGIAVWNREATAARSTTKLSQLMRLTLNAIAVPMSVFCVDGALLLDHADDIGSWPLICKDILASRGRNNFLVQDRAELQAVLAEVQSAPMILQQWVPNDKSDLRFFVVDSKVGLVIRRKGTDASHLNNVSAGGSAEIIPIEEIPHSTIAEVEQVADLFGRELCGIDYIFDTNEQRYVFLEINGTPQIVNGVFVTEKINAIVTGINQVKERGV